MWKHKVMVIGLLVVFLSGCESVATVPQENAVTAELDTQTIELPTRTLEILSKTPTVPDSILTSTSPPVTPLPTVTPTLQPTLTSTNCVEVLPTLPETATLTGSIFLEPANLDAESIVKIINMETKELTLLPGENYFFYVGDSPNKQWLVSKDIGQSQIILVDAKGEIYGVTDWDENWYILAGWLDNERLIIQLLGENTLDFITPIGLLNIHTKEYQEIVRDYPSQYFAAETAVDRFRWPITTIYHPDLTLVAYLARPTYGPGLSYMVFDMQSKQVVAELGGSEATIISPPKWSPDGSKLLIVKETDPDYTRTTDQREEFFTVTKSGEVEQVTQFNESHRESRIGTFNWSPNGRYVAFWFYDRSSDSNYEFLEILDLETSEVVNYCISSIAYTGGSAAPIWSPDSNALIVKRQIKAIDENGAETEFDEVILVDLVNGYAAKIAEYMRLLGWLVNKPTE